MIGWPCYMVALQWPPHDSLSAPISSAIYSCDSVLVYANFCDGAVGVFDYENLRLHCHIAPSAYYSFTIGNEQVNEWATRMDRKISNSSLTGQPRNSELFWKHHIWKREISNYAVLFSFYLFGNKENEIVVFKTGDISSSWIIIIQWHCFADLRTVYS